ncbi:MAG: SDR family NAD(P)-dependent oxidoreductase [Bacteroidia bacterium]|nr:SDR family NAD(P)-dependent oxidoreductase [Bacteroidia bacterium]
MSKKAIIIGASAGIGRALAIELGKNGYDVGITARRKELLESLQKEIPTQSWIQVMDVANTEESRTQLGALIEIMGGCDIIILNAAVGHTGLNWEENREMIQINTLGNVALGDFAFHYFKQKKSGHIVGISSVAKHRAFRTAIVYSATKSFLSAYLQGIRHFFAYKRVPVYVTDIRPGFVETFMTSQNDPKAMFWVSTPETAAYYIRKAIEKRKKVAYITPRWWWAGQLMQFLPDWVAHKM